MCEKNFHFLAGACMITLPNRRAARRLSILVASLLAIGACALLPLRPDENAKAPVLDGFGVATLSPSQANDAARKLFAQGMAQVYAFNEAEAIRTFKAALAQDRDCAMCAWGVALQMGPNINATKRGDLTEAVRYVDYALRHSPNATPRERDLIESLALRYGHASEARNTAPLMAEICSVPGGDATEKPDPLDIGYAARMRTLVERYPDDPDILSMYAEAEMVATRGDFWDRITGKPAGRIGELADRVEAGLVHHPDHVGLNHYMIHVVDAFQVAARAVPAADRLGALAPKSPHLLHMPAHTYAQVGRYADATRVNQLAVAADENMFAELKKQDFKITRDWRGHNRHFQWYGALMEGRGALALETARAAATQAAKGESEYSEYIRSLPLLTLVRLQHWDAILKEPLPTGDKGMATALGEMARGIALAHTGQTEAAKASLVRVEGGVSAVVKKRNGLDFFDKLLRSLANTAQIQLRAEIAFAEQRTDEALALQAEAVKTSFDAEGSEPPTLAGGTRLALGAMQAKAKRFAAAEKSYRDDLLEHPHSGWALQGLSTALLAQGKQGEARACGLNVKPRNVKLTFG
jgi:tetratricopeptide (TPR) repeat protein